MVEWILWSPRANDLDFFQSSLDRHHHLRTSWLINYSFNHSKINTIFKMWPHHRFPKIKTNDFTQDRWIYERWTYLYECFGHHHHHRRHRRRHLQKPPPSPTQTKVVLYTSFSHSYHDEDDDDDDDEDDNDDGGHGDDVTMMMVLIKHWCLRW